MNKLLEKFPDTPAANDSSIPHTGIELAEHAQKADVSPEVYTELHDVLVGERDKTKFRRFGPGEVDPSIHPLIMCRLAVEKHGKDPLVSNVASRHAFDEYCKHLEESVSGRGARRECGDSVWMVFIDLDSFKPVNDTHGHAAGDEMLQHVGDLLCEVFRESDFVARLGGDEFVAVCGVNDGKKDIQAMLERLIDTAKKKPFTFLGNTIPVQFSVGAAEVDMERPDTTETLRQADTAMYQGKKEGKGQWIIFKEEGGE